MDRNIFDFLNTQEIGVLAVEMLDGSPHGATVHFAYGENPFIFYFETNRSYKKSEALFGRAKSRATFVVTDANTMKSLQMDGEVRLVAAGSDREVFDEIYFERFPNKKIKAENPDVVCFVFVPSWWRYTEFKNPNGKMTLSSES